MIDAAQRSRILNYIAEARAAGATVALGGEAITGESFDKGFWVAPTILTGVTNDMTSRRYTWTCPADARPSHTTSCSETPIMLERQPTSGTLASRTYADAASARLVAFSLRSTLLT
ncbi:aldehyde dehydrogenase family protein [Mycobacterium lentiflavum]|uniref:Aldehyde dehydrogenase family protein n=1 Tax=Mycobacterium lentiflavum TaxID=141349 RepID=A0ABY3UKU9_MYCLN|nr:aldehyde dehydrogenase family protein [Mycobacterium lentiflavum]ULP40229.1 aldehyde dehydrogenase family protein [Mycobacterium lentiflavum]